MKFKIKWVDHHREPQCPPDPRYPNGKDLDMTEWLVPGWPTCKAELPYPAARCGHYEVECEGCGLAFAATTAGRPDDPRSVTVGCRKKDPKEVH